MSRQLSFLVVPILGAMCTLSSLRAQEVPVVEQAPPATEPQPVEPEVGVPEIVEGTTPEAEGEQVVPEEVTATLVAPPRAIEPQPEPQPTMPRKPQRRAGTQPFRLRHAETLTAERWAAQFRIEDNSGAAGLLPGTIGGFFSTAYGVTDRFMLQVQVSDGHQYETISAATTPGRVYDAGAQYSFVDDCDWTIAGRFDVVLADTSAFEPVNGSRKVSFQPGLLTNLSLCDSLDLYTSTTLRLTDSSEPALAVGVGIRAPLGKINFFLEADAIAQQVVGGQDILEAYLTPGIQYVLRDKIDINLSPSIGLSDTSFDWRFAVTMGVHF